MAMLSGKGTRCTLVPFVLLTLLECQVAVRLNIDEELVATEQCTDALRSVHRTFNYAKLFNPIFDGTYKIRNRASGKYLTGTKDGLLGTSIHHADSNGMTWKIKRVKVAGTPMYTLQNVNSGRTLSGHDGKVFSVLAQQKKKAGWNPFRGKEPLGEFAHWHLNLDEDGMHYVIGTCKDVKEVLKTDIDGLVELSTEDGPRDEWFLDIQQSWLRIPKTNKGGYMAQWPVAGNIPMWTGTNYTFFQLTDDGKFNGAEAYAIQRETYKIFGKTSETKRRIVQANYVKKCDAPAAMLAGFGLSTKLLQAVRVFTGEACKDLSLLNLSVGLKEIASEACFDECTQAADEELKEVPCRKPDNITALLERVVALPPCGTLPPATVEKLAEQTMLKRCLKYAKPNLLYTPETNGVATADGHPTCSVDSKSRSAKDIKTLGQCYSGTTCQCPRTYIKTRKSYAQLKYFGNLMVQPGDANLVSLISDQVSSSARSAAIKVALRGLTVAAAVKAIPLSPTFIPKVAWNVFQWGKSAAQWRCAASLNCWPVKPKRKREANTKKACRMPEEARKGGSDVWFLPPPGTKVQNKKGVMSVFGRCELVPCEGGEMMGERVGFGPAGKQNEAELTFVNGTKNTVGCPDSSRPLKLSECRKAATQYGYANLRESALSSFPAGCLFYHGHGIYWNTNAVGQAQAQGDSANVCAEKVSKASGGSPSVYNCQNLKFEEMSPAQQTMFLQDVRMTFPAEWTKEL